MLHYIKNKKHAIISGLLISAMVFFIQFSEQAEIQRLLARVDGIFYDLRLTASLSDRKITEQTIIIVDIDENSLAEQGRWPWSRNKLAELVTKLSDAEVAVIAFDILFGEPERNPGKTVAEYYQRQQLAVPEQFPDIIKALDGDAAFAESITATDVVLGILFHHDNKLSKGQLPSSVVDNASINDLTKTIRVSFSSHESNIDIIQAQAPGSGFINATMDEDGFIRRAALIAEYQGKFYPSLALETARLLTFSEEISLEIVDIGKGVQQIAGLRWGNELIPTDAAGRVLVPYRGKRKSFPYLSATDVLQGDFDAALLQGAVVFVGTSAVGLADLRATPVDLNYPGVEVHANVLEGLLQPEILPRQPDWWEAALALMLFCLALICVFSFPARGPLSLILTAMLLMAVISYFNFWLWYQHQISLMLSTSLLLIFMVAVVNLGLGFFKENEQKKMIKSIFDQYVPPAHIDEMLAHPDSVNLQGERKEMTVLFSDIRDFTSISESLGAAQLKNLLNSYFSPITKTIFDNQGTIDKYVGDMVMAFWGAPLNDANHVENALNAALQMLAITAKLRVQFQQQGMPQLYVGIGVNTGNMSVGDMGSEYRRAYTVLGDAVNLGSRLESLTKFYGVDCLVSESCKKLCPKHSFRFIDRVQVKGKHQPVSIYELLAEQGVDFSQEQVDYERAYQNYLARDWDRASTQFSHLIAAYSDRKIYHIYLARIKEFRQQPLPDNWHGVYTHTAK